MDAVAAMDTLAESNPYIRDPEARLRMIEEDAQESCAFEGARGLPRRRRQSPSRKRHPTISARKPASGR
jgi:hypothetical protein